METPNQNEYKVTAYYRWMVLDENGLLKDPDYDKGFISRYSRYTTEEEAAADYADMVKRMGSSTYHTLILVKQYEREWVIPGI